MNKRRIPGWTKEVFAIDPDGNVRGKVVEPLTDDDDAARFARAHEHRANRKSTIEGLYMFAQVLTVLAKPLIPVGRRMQIRRLVDATMNFGDRLGAEAIHDAGAQGDGEAEYYRDAARRYPRGKDNGGIMGPYGGGCSLSDCGPGGCGPRVGQGPVEIPPPPWAQGPREPKPHWSEPEPLIKAWVERQMAVSDLLMRHGVELTWSEQRQAWRNEHGRIVDPVLTLLWHDDRELGRWLRGPMPVRSFRTQEDAAAALWTDFGAKVFHKGGPYWELAPTNELVLPSEHWQKLDDHRRGMQARLGAEQKGAVPGGDCPCGEVPWPHSHTAQVPPGAPPPPAPLSDEQAARLKGLKTEADEVAQKLANVLDGKFSPTPDDQQDAATYLAKQGVKVTWSGGRWVSPKRGVVNPTQLALELRLQELHKHILDIEQPPGWFNAPAWPEPQRADPLAGTYTGQPPGVQTAVCEHVAEGLRGPFAPSGQVQMGPHGRMRIAMHFPNGVPGFPYDGPIPPAPMSGEAYYQAMQDAIRAQGGPPPPSVWGPPPAPAARPPAATAGAPAPAPAAAPAVVTPAPSSPPPGALPAAPGSGEIS